MWCGLAPLTVGRPSPEVLVDAAAAAGFDRVGLTLWPPDGPPSSLCDDAAALGALRGRLSSVSVAVVDVGVVALGPALDPDEVRAVLEAGAALGGDRVIVLNREAVAGRAAAQFSAVCDLAAPLGMKVAVEFMPYTATPALADALRLVRAVAAPNAGVVIDVLHLHRSGGSPADLAAVEPAAVHLVQLCDARSAAPPPELLRTEALTDRLYPGEGELPLAELLAAIPPGVPVTLEAPVARDAGRPPVERAIAAAAATRRFLSRR